jgi:diketogulonate reductase-like aldo/keto reductase
MNLPAMNLPAMGFGTSPYRPDGTRVDVEQPVRLALASGYRMFDLAEMYGNERTVGRALRGTPRHELRLIGKAWRTNFRPENLRRACEDSLRRIGIDAFDLYLLHAPDAWRHVAPLEDPETLGWDEFVRRGAAAVPDDVPLAETWQAMQALVTAGLTTAIGVSNFTQAQIDTLGAPYPAANEIPCWPVDASLRNDLILLGYSPLQRDVLASPVIANLAEKHARTPAQIVLRSLIQRGIRPLTFSTNAQHIRESLGALDFTLNDADVNAIASIA